MSDCQTTDEKLLDYLYGELPLSEADLVREHLVECAPCRQKAEGFSRVRTVARLVPLAQPSSGVIERLIQRATPSPWMRHPAWAMAAALLLVGSFASWRLLHHEEMAPEKAPQGTVATPPPQTTSAVEAVPEADKLAVEKKEAPRSKRATSSKVPAPQPVESFQEGKKDRIRDEAAPAGEMRKSLSESGRGSATLRSPAHPPRPIAASAPAPAREETTEAKPADPPTQLAQLLATADCESEGALYQQLNTRAPIQITPRLRLRHAQCERKLGHHAEALELLSDLAINAPPALRPEISRELDLLQPPTKAPVPVGAEPRAAPTGH